jgi:hypothetical protein
VHGHIQSSAPAAFLSAGFRADRAFYHPVEITVRVTLMTGLDQDRSICMLFRSRSTVTIQFSLVNMLRIDVEISNALLAGP